MSNLEVPAGRRGYTFIELVIGLTLGVIILAVAVSFLIVQMGSLEGSDVREDMARTGRYVGTALRHDIQRAGVDIQSTTAFGTVAVWPGAPGDTLVLLHVPYAPSEAPAHLLDPPDGSNAILAPGGTCGSECIDVLTDSGVPLDIRPGDLARLQVGDVRRLIMVDQTTVNNDTSVAVEFTTADTLLHQPAGLVGNLRLTRFGTYAQRLAPVMYYLDDQNRLFRAVGLNMDGTPAGDVIAYGVESFEVRLLFADGDELDHADPYDTDETNDYDDIVAVKVRVGLRTPRPDPRVNGGNVLHRTYEWVISPRNLRYEKNRG